VKRFWDDAAVSPKEGGFEILLDGRPMRLPSGTKLRVGARALAEAVAEEWRTAGGGKGGEMSFADTPLTRLAGTAQECIAPTPEATADAIARYGESDLLCYRAESPRELVERQAHQWQPWLDWLALNYDAQLRVTAGVNHVRQHHDSISALRRSVARLDEHALAALSIAVPALGSLVLGLALLDGQVEAEEAFRLSALDELFQAEKWGEDAEAAARRRAVLADVILAGRYIGLTQTAA
jgi:chaperone required for assembly of F1-ATPase